MKKIELLSPVGDFECLKAAVQNGADSVYFGASSFNARASATNFDLTDLKDAISYAKLRNVKTHLALNTLIDNDEFEEAVLLAKKAYEFGIDALIVQDLGLARYLIQNFPDLPIHASTQMTIHNLEGVLQAEKLGFKRVVLSRELSLEEIEYICSHTKVEIETFVHGALCISYSGQCLFSSMVGGRSGNRGRCAQPCRLPYDLTYETKDGTKGTVRNESGYLLSTRDLCGLNFLPALINAGVMCFKIEGRMKKPEYVATVTRIYRKYIDMVLSGEPYKVDPKDVEDLKQVFNRGGFSSGHLDNTPNKDLVYSKKQNNMGIYVGNVANLKPNKGHVFLNLTSTLSIGDTIEFEKENTKYTVSELMIKEKNVTSAFNKQFVEIGRMKGNINIGDKVFKVTSKELSAQAKESYHLEHKKIPLKAKVILKIGEPIILSVSTKKTSNKLFDNIEITLNSSESPVEAKSRPIDKEKIIAQVNKTGDSIFSFDSISVDLEDNLFLPSVKGLNELRRNALEEILHTANSRLLRKSPKLAEISTNVLKTSKKKVVANQKEISVLLNVLDEEFDYSKLENITNIYIPLKYFSLKKYDAILETLTNKFNTYIYIPTIIKSNYKNLLNILAQKSILKFNIKGFVVSGISTSLFVEKIKQEYGDKYDFIGNYTLNVYNSHTISEWKNLGLKKLTISPELNSEMITDLLNDSQLPEEFIVYGRTPLMNINYCLLGKTNKCYPTCGVHCQDLKKYYLKDRLGLYFRIIPDSTQTVSTIYNSKITSISSEDFIASSYRIDCIDESIAEINSIVKTVISGSRLEGKEYTNGNLNKEI